MPPTQRNCIHPPMKEADRLLCRGRQEMVWQWLLGTPQIGPDCLFEAEPFRQNSKCTLQTEQISPPRNNFNKLLEWRKKRTNIGSCVREPEGVTSECEQLLSHGSLCRLWCQLQPDNCIKWWSCQWRLLGNYFCHRKHTHTKNNNSRKNKDCFRKRPPPTGRGQSKG